MNQARLSTLMPAALLMASCGAALAVPLDAERSVQRPDRSLTARPSFEDGARRGARPDALHLQCGAVDTECVTGAVSEHLDLTRRRGGLPERVVLQLDGPMTPARRAALERAGVRLGQYLPVNAYVIPTDGLAPKKLDGLEFVRWAGAYDDSWKVASDLGEGEYQDPQRRAMHERGELLLNVALFEGADAEATAARIEAAAPGAVVLGDETMGANPTLRVVAMRGVVEAIASVDDVMSIADAPELNLRMATTTWVVQSNQSGFTPVHDAGIRGEGQVVGVIDSLIDEDHCSFDDTVPVGPNHRKILALNGTTFQGSHGTYVAGILAGDPETPDGTPDNRRGIAFKSKLVYNTLPPFTENDVIGRFDLHHSQGARIHQNSWGDDSTTAYRDLARGIDIYTHDNEDDLVVFASTNLSSLRNPENAKNVLAVAAVNDAPSQDVFASGGAGPTIDGRRKPDVMAPGSGVQGSLAGSPCATFSSIGTSYAAPHVSGAAALVRQYFLEGWHAAGEENPSEGFTPSGALMKAMILNGAADVTGIGGYPSDTEGWGRLLLDDAMYFAGETRGLFVSDVRNDSGEALETGGAHEYTVHVDGDGETLKFTMVFTDKEGAPSASFAPVNDLDLEAESPSGTTYLGNVFQGGVSAAGGSPDAINNVEQVHVPSPETGEWTVRVLGSAVNDGPQGYALVATGEVRGPAPCPTDLDGDGVVGQFDLAQLINAWGPNPGSPADIDGSGAVTAHDLALLIASWGSCG